MRISIHAAREGGDATLSILDNTKSEISIHAAREGGDLQHLFDAVYVYHFNPRRP